MRAPAAIVSSLHVFALALGLAAVFFRGRALRGPLDQAGLLRLFAADNVWGLAAALWLVTGLARAFGGLEKGSAFYLGSSLFWTKMVLMMLAGVNALVFHMTTYRSVDEWDTSSVTPQGARYAGLFSLALWAGVIVFGRITAYDWMTFK